MITIRRLEQIQLVVYLLSIVFSYLVSGVGMCIGVAVGGIIVFIDWFLLKNMSFYFVKKGGKGAIFGSLIRCIFIGILLLLSFSIFGLNVGGVLWGVSIVPLSLLLVTFYLTFNYLKAGGS